jgi:uncharacterized protein (DUF1330 family)
MTEQDLKDLQARNEARAKEAIEKMGAKYLCHPDNAVTKKRPKKPILVAKTKKRAK